MALISTGFIRNFIKYTENFNLKVVEYIIYLMDYESYSERRVNRNKKELINNKKKYNTISFYRV